MGNNILDYEFNLEEPHSRIETILHNMIDSAYELEDPKSRIEYLLREFAESMSNGPAITYMTQNDWNTLTFEEKRNQGLVLVGDSESINGVFHNYSIIDSLYKYDDDNPNVVSIFNDDGFTFYGFYSNTAGDRVTAGSRGGTFSTNDLRFICNGWLTSQYGNYFAFAKTSEALAATNTQYYAIYPVDGFDMYVSGNLSGGWYQNNDVTFEHDNTIQKLQDLFSRDEHTIYNYNITNNKVIFSDTSITLLENIQSFLNSES